MTYNNCIHGAFKPDDCRSCKKQPGKAVWGVSPESRALELGWEVSFDLGTCPDCDQTFKNWRGVRLHWGREHKKEEAS